MLQTKPKLVGISFNNGDIFQVPCTNSQQIIFSEIVVPKITEMVHFLRSYTKNIKAGTFAMQSRTKQRP